MYMYIQHMYLVMQSVNETQESRGTLHKFTIQIDDVISGLPLSGDYFIFAFVL